MCNFDQIALKTFKAIFLLFFCSQMTYGQLDRNGMTLGDNTNDHANYRISAQTGTIPGLPMPFNNVRALSEINNSTNADAYPWLSSDGLRLYYTKGFSNGTNYIYYTSRPNIGSNFDTPQNLVISTLTSTNIISCWLTQDELSIYVVGRDIPNGNLAASLFHSKRTSKSSNFSTLNLVTLTGSISGQIVGVTFTSDMNELLIYNLSNQSIQNQLVFVKTSEDNYAFSKLGPKVQGYMSDPGQLSYDGLSYYFSLRDSIIATPNNYFMTIAKRNSLTDDFSSIYYIDDTLINNYNNYNLQPYVVPNGDIMVFVRNPVDAWGKSDLYIAYNSTTVSPCNSPTITGKSSNGSFCVKSSNPLVSVTAIGSQLNYQWYKNQLLVNDATASGYNLSTNNTSATGLYLCIISNTCGSVTSTGINITINTLPSVSLDLSSINYLCNTVGSVSLSGGVPFGGVYLYNNNPSSSLDISSVGNYSILYKYTDVNSCVNTASGILSITTCSSQNTCPGNNCNTIPGTISGNNPTLSGTNCIYSNPPPSFTYDIWNDTLYLNSTSKGVILIHQWKIAELEMNYVSALNYILTANDKKRDSIDVVLIVTDLKGCTDILNKTISIPTITNLLKQNVEQIVKIYPNPFNSSISIETGSQGVFSIYNMLGQLAFTKVISNSEEIDLNTLPSGSYYFQFVSNKFLQSGKLIKSK